MRDVNITTFEYFYDTFHKAVFRSSFMLLKNKSDSEDITQETFVTLYLHTKEFKDENHIKSWLLRVAINKSKNLISRKRFEQPLLNPENLSHIDADNTLLTEVLSLPYLYGTVLYLHYFEGYKTKEIAKIIDKSDVNVRVMLSRARELLKLAL